MVESSRPEGSRPDGALTAEEREALRVALKNGYFEVPRTATLGEVADELDRPDTVTSEQLRRGMSIVLRESDLLSSDT